MQIKIISELQAFKIFFPCSSVMCILNIVGSMHLFICLFIYLVLLMVKP